MDCQQRSELSLAYIDGQLSEELSHQLERHLGGCAECCLRHAEEVELAAAFDLPTAGLAGAGFVEAVMRRVELVRARGPRLAPVQLRPWVRQALVPLLAAAALIVIAWVARGDGGLGSQAAAYLAVADGATSGLRGGLGEMATAVGESGLRSYRSGQAMVGAQSGALGSAVQVATVALALLCGALVARFRTGFGKE